MAVTVVLVIVAVAVLLLLVVVVDAFVVFALCIVAVVVGVIVVGAAFVLFLLLLLRCWSLPLCIPPFFPTPTSTHTSHPAHLPSSHFLERLNLWYSSCEKKKKVQYRL